MKTFVKTLGVVALVVSVAPLVSAQWPSFPTSDVPKTADGKPNLTAPAPKMPDGKPDLSGLWENAPLGFGPKEPAPPPGQPPLATFFDVGAGFKEGLPLRPWAAELLKKRRKITQRTIPTLIVCPWAFCNSTSIPSRGKLSRLRNWL